MDDFRLASELDRDRAGFWRRFVASLIDGIVVSVVIFLLGLFLGNPYFLSFPFGAAYFGYFHGRTGQTPGDAALGVKVVDLRGGTGAPIGYGRALLRWIVSYVSGIVLLLGYLWMLWDRERQTWHDKAAGSVVVKLAASY